MENGKRHQLYLKSLKRIPDIHGIRIDNFLIPYSELDKTAL